MPLLQTDNITKSFGDRLLFADINITLNEGDKIGLIARNGKGKTTLLKIIAGLEDYDSGKIIKSKQLRIGYLGQEPTFNPNLTILENLIDSVNDAEEWNRADKATEMLHRFQIQNMQAKPTEMSGGQLKRAAIARVLLSNPDLLLLDEPTNHLDIDAIEKLEQTLSTSKTTLLMVTHDRYFLDRVCNRIIEIDREQLHTYNGDYSYYLDKRQQRIASLSAELDKIKNLLRTEQEWMRRQPQARGSKAKYRIDQFYNLKEKSRINLQEHNVDPSDTKAAYLGNKIFEAKNVSKKYGSKTILNNWSYNFARYDKIGIIGHNGVGKSTFIKMLMGLTPPDEGTFDIGQTVKWGYYSQQGMVDFDEKKKVIDAVREIAEEVKIDDKTTLSASQFLNKFLFSVADQQNYIYKLSGGERRRLNLAVTLMRSPNFLIFDEPTNDLDIVTLGILEEYIVAFKGCVIVVSHDRFFLDRIASHIFVFRGDGVIEDFPGNYSMFKIAEKEKKKIDSAPSSQTHKPPQTRTPRERRGLTFKENREKAEIEELLPKLENEKRELEQKMSTGTMESATLVDAGNRIGELIEKIDALEMRLLELMEKE